ncbi:MULTISPECIES: gamma-glutamyl-gamma-aminobutyrate hydrolase family protein [unclassified Streptomyces]|uniref:gamma-glutamyl-gamma-aminobutyrate hydrolase family protein n=1 Tax=unclassified Streptomyces TaxID=2593676 RepID=UPI0035E23CCE
MSEPLIGVTTYLDRARWGVWDMEAALLPAPYPRLVRESGGIAVMLPPDRPAVAAAVVARLDGLVVAGGADVEPVRYGAEPDPRTGPPARERDSWELALIDAALASGTPLLGICRGMQLLNVALGGTLVQHLDGHVEAVGVIGRHKVEPVPGTRYASLVPETAEVPTYHHQAVDRLGAGLAVSARAEDGTVEAVEAVGPAGPVWALGVQWHPEMGEDRRVMRGLIEAAAAAAGGGRT